MARPSARPIANPRIWNPAATSSLLSTVAGGLTTVDLHYYFIATSGLATVRTNMTALILDQFLRRRINQAYFGFFVGLALYSLVTLATVAKPLNPIFGATLAFLLTVVALYLLIILLYTTINQMRPVQIIEAIHDHVLAARERQLKLIRKTRRTPSSDGATIILVKADEEGFVTRIDVDTIGRAAQNLPDEVEITLVATVGSYVAFQDLIATIMVRTTTM